MQQNSLLELIKSIKEPNDIKLTLPEFYPNNVDSDAHSWCNTVDLCMEEKPLSGSGLIIVMSKALKGTAASWLAQNSFAGITWPQLKDLFLARFDSVETPATTVYKIFNEHPKEGKCLSSYANRILSSCWRPMSTDQIAITVTLAHTARIEPRLQRLAFTTEIDSRNRLRLELMAFVYRKMGPPIQEKSSISSDAKRPRLDPSTRRCYNCGRGGHHAFECRSTINRDSSTAARLFSGSIHGSTGSTLQPKEAEAQKKISVTTCYYCGEAGHIVTRCPKKGAISTDAKAERRLDICTVKPASDYLLNSGEKFSFCLIPVLSAL